MAYPFRLLAAFCLTASFAAAPVLASDHLDAPNVIADPAADIGDLFAWTAEDSKRLNLVLTVQGAQFSDQLNYVFHIDSGSAFPSTTSSVAITCRFSVDQKVTCLAGDFDHVHGLADRSEGLLGEHGHFRVFAGVRDDPFYNNVAGTRAAYDVARKAIADGAELDASGCPLFPEETTKQILDAWRHTNDGPGQNFLNGWKTAALVVSIDLSEVSVGGNALAIWAGTYGLSERLEAETEPLLGARLDRFGRPLVGNALVALFQPDHHASDLKERYNKAPVSQWPRFERDIGRGLALYDGFDGICGNQWLANTAEVGTERYDRLAQLLADDRIWIHAAESNCKGFLGVERDADSNARRASKSCGGRNLHEDAIDRLRSLWAMGQSSGIDDGVDKDDHAHSLTRFPFLAAP